MPDKLTGKKEGLKKPQAPFGAKPLDMDQLPAGMSLVEFSKSKVPSSGSNVYFFSYSSPTATQKSPLVLLVNRRGRVGKVFKFRGHRHDRSNTYVQGLELNSLVAGSPQLVAKILQAFSTKGINSYKDVKAMDKNAEINFRVYNYKYITDFHTVTTLQFVTDNLK